MIRIIDYIATKVNEDFALNTFFCLLQCFLPSPLIPHWSNYFENIKNIENSEAITVNNKSKVYHTQQQNMTLAIRVYFRNWR